ncbi:MAG: diacylglycerol kinase family protein [Chloroflexi bacterium]|nr:diacylglycerol kinase family protein [Chloroflexota bacterium]
MRPKNERPSLLRAFGFAGAGVLHMLRSQRNARIHLMLTLAALGLGWFFSLAASEWAILVLTIGFVFAAETMNTAVEAVVDLVSPERHPLAKIAKDAAAGAVLIAASTAVLVAIFLFLPRLLTLF